MTRPRLMKPTPAQLKYLQMAEEIDTAGRGHGNYFVLWGPGESQTGIACLRCDWIDESSGGGGVYFLTPAGRAILRNHAGYAPFHTADETPYRGVR